MTVASSFEILSSIVDIHVGGLIWNVICAIDIIAMSTLARNVATTRPAKIKGASSRLWRAQTLRFSRAGFTLERKSSPRKQRPREDGSWCFSLISHSSIGICSSRKCGYPGIALWRSLHSSFLLNAFGEHCALLIHQRSVPLSIASKWTLFRKRSGLMLPKVTPFLDIQNCSPRSFLDVTDVNSVSSRDDFDPAVSSVPLHARYVYFQSNSFSCSHLHLLFLPYSIPKVVLQFSSCWQRQFLSLHGMLLVSVPALRVSCYSVIVENFENSRFLFLDIMLTNLLRDDISS